MFVMLQKAWPGSFGRTVTVAGEKRRLVFEPGDPVDLSAEELAGVRGDLGKALLAVELDERGKPHPIDADVDKSLAAASEANGDASPESPAGKRKRK